MSVSPAMTFNAAGDLHSSASLAASGTFNFDVDWSAKFAGILHALNTPGGSVSATNGLQVQVYRRYGTGPTNGQTPVVSITIPSVASTAASADLQLGPGKYHVICTNLDGTNAITVEVTSSTVDSVG